MSFKKSIEQGRKLSSERIITPQTLLEDNRKSTKNILDWQEAKKKKGSLTLFIVCSDARIVTAKIFGEKTVASISSISGATDLESFKDLLQHDSIGQIVVVGHFDYQTIKDGEPPCGCGGHKVSQTIQAGEQVPHSGLQEFVSEQILPDFLEQIMKTVEDVSVISGKPVLGIAVEHLTSAAFPIVEHLPGKKPFMSENIKEFEWKKISDKLLKDFLRFGSGMFPEIEKIDDLHEPFRQFILKNRSHILRDIDKIPKLIEKNKVQNPSTVVISTVPIPLALRFKEKFGDQNEGFVIRQSFLKKDTQIEMDDVNDIVKGAIAIQDVDFDLVASQLFYPISHAIKAAKGQDFYDTKTILIETPGFELSAQMALRLSKMDFVKEWMEKKGGKILVSSVDSGKTIDIKDWEDLKPK